MKNDRIKELLHAWRPGEPADTEVARAREAAAADPELALWLDRERAFDQAFADKLRQVQPPPALLSQIRAAVEAERTVPFAQPARKSWRPFAIGLAASLLLAVGIFTLGVRQGQRGVDLHTVDLAGFVNFTANEAWEQPLQQVRGAQAALSELAALSSPVPTHLPAILGDYSPVMAGTLDLNGTRASVIGFESDAGYRLMVFNRSCLGARCKKLTRPVLYDLGDRMAAAWIDGNHVFVLVGDRRGEAMMRGIHDI